MKKNKKLSVPINFRVDDSLSEGITSMANQLGLTESEMIRSVLKLVVLNGNARDIESQFTAMTHQNQLSALDGLIFNRAV